MITKINTHEGVPLGGNNFEDLLSYIRNFLSANFSFSTSAVGNQGGYFLPDDFVFTDKAAVSPSDSAYFFGPNVVAAGSLFGKKGDEYYRFEVKNHTVTEPQINVWTVLATNTSGNNMVYTNTSEENKLLPYRPLFKTGDGEFQNGYQEVRLNGMVQDDYSLELVSNNNFQEQELSFNTLSFGPELPKPVLNNVYTKFSMGDGFTKSELESQFDSKLTFEFTNFSTEFGGHIILHKPGTELYVYLPMDYGVAGEAPSGSYRVIDYARSIVEINPSSTQLEMLRIDSEIGDANTTVKFVVFSTEQLLQDTVNNTTRYRSRYGAVYNGNIDDAVLLEYSFDGSTNIVRKIPNTEYSGVASDVILVDDNGNYTGNVILAVTYRGVANKEILSLAQKSRYIPDTLQLYYNTGIILPTSGGTSSIRAVVESNSGSWFNQDVYSAEYSPVNRVEETFYSLITTAEEANFGITFNPDQQFEIVDTIGLSNLNDVTSVDTNDILLYNGAVFVGVQHTLANLIDSNIVSPQTNNVLQYIGGSWVNRTPTQMLISTNIGSVLTYSATHAISANNHIPHKSYVDGAISSSITNHNNTFTAHGATPSNVANRVVLRNATGGWANVGNPTAALTASSESIVNINYLRTVASATAATANRLVLRDANGRAQVGNPTAGSNNTDIATTSWVRTIMAAASEGIATSGSYSGGYIRLGDEAAFVWSSLQQVNGLTDTAAAVITGVALPAGSKTVVAEWAQIFGTSNIVQAFATKNQTDTTHFSGNTPRTAYWFNRKNNGASSSISVRGFWIVFWN